MERTGRRARAGLAAYGWHGVGCWLGAGCCLAAWFAASAPARAQTEPGADPPPEDPPAETPPPEGGQDEEPAPPAEPAPRGLVPPRIVSSSPPRYPASRVAEGLHPSVVLVVTLDEHGGLVDSTVEHSADADFDRAAQETLRTWRFAPATRDGEAIASRIRVAVHFELPSFDVATAAEGPLGPHEPHGAVEHHGHDAHVGAAPEPGSEPAPAAGAASDPDAAADEHGELGVTAAIEAELRDLHRGAGSFEIDRDLLAAAPRQDGGDLLLAIPGVFAARTEGLAVGHRIQLRGFDADHGQDLEISVGGLPVNQPSHIHGQGYVDLGFLIPEVVRRVRATEGVADPRQGDFAVAGSLGFDLGVAPGERGLHFETGYGLYDTFRQLAVWAPEGERDETFGAVQYRHTEGFGQRRAGDAGSAIVQAGARSGSWRLRGLGVLYGARADLAGVVRVDDVAAERVGFYDAYAHPTAQAQSALAARFMGGFFGDYLGTGGETGGLGLWLGGDLFRSQQNFTGFVQRSRTLPDTAGRGDLIEQRNETFSAGITGRYRTPEWRPWEWAGLRLEVGLDGRLDFIDQAQNLLGTPRNQTWDTRVDASVVGTNVGLYGDVEASLTEHVTLHVGMRSTLLLYEIDDRLGNFVPLVRPDERTLPGFRRSAGGVAVGPRASAQIAPLEWLTFRASYGEGFRSPQARTLEDAETAPFTTVRSADLGAIFAHEGVVRVTVAGFYTELSDDVALDPREGRLERVGASRRLGATLYLETRPLEWLTGALSVTYVDAEVLEPPPPTADDPQPAFVRGQNLPYVPPVVVRADLGARGTLVERFLDQPLRGRLGVGYSLLGPRPLPYGGFADPVNLLDASAGIGWGPVDLGVSFYNLFDTRWAASELHYTSNWEPEGIPTRVPARHVMAGSPFTFMVTLGITP